VIVNFAGPEPTIAHAGGAVLQGAKTNSHVQRAGVNVAAKANYLEWIRA
jgi:hypothetical protein